MKQGRLGYNSSNDRYGLLASDLWIDAGFHCGEGLEVLVDDKWVRTRMEMKLARECIWWEHHIAEIWNMYRQEYRNNLVARVTQKPTD